MKIKRFLCVLFTLFILISVFPVQVFAATVFHVDGIPAREIGVIGTAGLPVKVMSDASFLTPSVTLRFFGEGEIYFVSCVCDDDYPVITAKYIYDKTGSEVEISSFASGSPENGACYLNIEVTLTADTEDVAFPLPEGFASPETSPVSCPAGKSMTRLYVAAVDGNGNVTDTGDIPTDRDINYSEMKTYWDGVFAGGFRLSGELSDGAKDAMKLMREYTVRKTILGDGGITPLDVFLSDEIADAEFYVSYADSVISDLTELYSSKYLILTLGVPSLRENLEALTELKICMSALRDLGMTEEAENIGETYENLASSVAYALKNTADSLSCRFEAAEVKGSADNITLTLDPSHTATDLRRWYLFDRMIPYKTAPTELYGYARGALELTSFPADGQSLEAAIISNDPDLSRTLVIGRGVSASLALEIAKGEMSFENHTCNGEKVSGTFEIEESTVTLKVSSSHMPVSVEFPFFAENIEYASCGFDYTTGVVTCPAGRTEIEVRLSESPAEIAEDNVAAFALEKALFTASLKSTDDCTDVSLSIFNEAYDSAISARSSIAREKLKAAEELNDASSKLSKTVSEYLYKPYSGDAVGTVSNDSIYQKFSLPSDGDITDIFVSGEFETACDAAIYTLRDDGYTAKELKAMAEGEKTDGGFLFRFDTEAEKNTEYLLCIMREGGNVTLMTYSANEEAHELYITETGSIKAFANASLGLEITVRQADRSDLDTFYKHCLSEDVSDYTRESRNNLSRALENAKTVLTTPSVTKKECKDIYKALQKAYAALETYASDKKAEDPPLITYILIGGVAVILFSVTVSSLRTSKRGKGKNKEENQ